jgi:dCTP diphosphatase
MDNVTSVEKLKNLAKQFGDEREWQRYHTPKNLSMYIAIEAAELMEIFAWVGSKESIQELEKRRADVEAEVADVAWCLLTLCARFNIDLSNAMENKLLVNTRKYPIEKCKGLAVKSDRL